MGCCTVARLRSQITPGPPAVIIFTALLLIVTLLNLEALLLTAREPAQRLRCRDR